MMNKGPLYKTRIGNRLRRMAKKNVETAKLDLQGFSMFSKGTHTVQAQEFNLLPIEVRGHMLNKGHVHPIGDAICLTKKGEFKLARLLMGTVKK